MYVVVFGSQGKWTTKCSAARSAQINSQSYLWPSPNSLYLCSASNMHHVRTQPLLLASWGGVTAVGCKRRVYVITEAPAPPRLPVYLWLVVATSFHNLNYRRRGHNLSALLARSKIICVPGSVWGYFQHTFGAKRLFVYFRPRNGTYCLLRVLALKIPL